MCLLPNVEVKEHHLYGFKCRGIFAKETIRKGEIIWEWNPESQRETLYCFTATEMENHPQKEILKNYSYMTNDDTFVSTLHPEEDPSYFFNHSCEPNVGYKGDTLLIAIRNVSKGEHLVYDYAFTETESSMHYGLRCLCGSKGCRGILTFGQWRSRSYVNKYRDYVTDYIRNKHDESGWFDPRVERRFRDKERNVYGLFCRARHAFKAGETILVFGGKVVHYNDLFNTQEHDFTSREYELSLQIHNDFWQIPIIQRDGSFGETSDYVNHSCDPNCGMKDSITVVAMRNIASNDEITIDYAMVNSGIMLDGCDNFVCECGSGICRGKVTSFDWKLPQVQQRYHNFFSPFVQQLIAKQTNTADSIIKP